MTAELAPRSGSSGLPVRLSLRGLGVSGLVIWSQWALLLALSVCVALMPHFLFSRNMGGMSNYGVHLKTVVPFSAGILASAALLLKASRAGDRSSDVGRRLCALYRFTAVAYLIDLLSTYPYKSGDLWARTHTCTNIVMAVLQIVGAVVLALIVRDGIGRALLALSLVGITALALTYVGALHILFVAEVCTGAAFGCLLVRATRKVFAAPPTT